MQTGTHLPSLVIVQNLRGTIYNTKLAENGTLPLLTDEYISSKRRVCKFYILSVQFIILTVQCLSVITQCCEAVIPNKGRLLILLNCLSSVHESLNL
jgi:hypothetical protein